ncbi:RHS repeat-associated core domain-containing protein (plasmid) [Arthrobacter sp. YA7-1]|uniref:RHS repeat-associated core domain-containing protein n=1 Tax=Arthrobacter sp. YA7-1 TaxID=2987701 RepID=UPI0022267862|nr:RHS repeat-associated core domain-containing protein [Arthrobacter sp. YA7-1]UYY83684.1 RHS repeat-associated core domain-containing protein [Arthrobacter sp. YA7-1]
MTCQSGQRTSSGAIFYYTTDAPGSALLLTDSSPAAAATYSYDSWGNTTSSGAKAAVNPRQYGGGYYDASTQRIKFGARYYNPYRGRFTQPDPSGQEANRYLYTGASPLSNSDPSGQAGGSAGWGFCLGICVGASIGGDQNGPAFNLSVGIGVEAGWSFNFGGTTGTYDALGTDLQCSASAGPFGVYGSYGIGTGDWGGGWSPGAEAGCSFITSSNVLTWLK